MRSVDHPSAVLVDSYGRVITDLRISVTNRCNFQCVYCHNEGQGPVRRVSALADELTAFEIEQVARVARTLGVREVKLSGGEPLVRRDCEAIVEAVARHLPVSMVTNGALLAERAAALAAAGLSRVNISMDSVHADVFRDVRGGALRPVLAGIDAALRAGLAPVKLNMVVFDKTIDGLDELLAFVRGRAGLTLQLIQYMPEITGRVVRGVGMERVHRLLAERADHVDIRAMHHRRVYAIDGANVEVVDPVGNAEFCAHCHRLRVTADGHIKGCLNRFDDLVPMRDLDDAGVAAAFRAATQGRMPYYPDYVQRQRVRAGAGQ